jgi:streptogrisin C
VNSYVAKRVRYSRQELSAVVDGLNRTLRVPNTSWAIDPVTNQVVVRISDTVAERERAQVYAAVAKFGNRVREEHVHGWIKETSLAGGDHIEAGVPTPKPGGYNCSAGFNVRTIYGEDLVLTAGHCIKPWEKYMFYSREGQIGLGADFKYGPSDYGKIPSTGALALAAGARLEDGSIQPISHATDSLVGQWVCGAGDVGAQGRTRVACGSVTATNIWINTDDGVRLVGMNAGRFVLGPGASGGPVFSDDAGLGIIHGTVEQFGETIYQPLKPVMTAYAASLLGEGGIIGLAGKCVDVKGWNSANTTPVILYDCNGQDNQKWEWRAQDQSIRSLGKCLDVDHGDPDNGTRVLLFDCQGSVNQQWVQTQNRGIMNPSSGRCLDVPNGNTENGTQLIIYDCQGSINQKWYIGYHE